MLFSPRQSARDTWALAVSSSWEERGGAWSVPWSDLMLTMFVIFLGLYAYSAGPQQHPDDAPPRVETSPEERQPDMDLRGLAGLFEQMRKRLEPRLGAGAMGYESRAGIWISLRGDEFFRQNRGTMRPEALPVLREIADLLHMARSHVLVAGFASEVSPAAPNPFEVAILRAAQVAAFLTSEGGVNPAMLSVQGFGLAYPRVPALSEGEARRNQRVEIRIAPEQE